MAKYRLTDEAKVIEKDYSKKTLYRIQAIVDFGDVKDSGALDVLNKIAVGLIHK